MAAKSDRLWSPFNVARMATQMPLLLAVGKTAEALIRRTEHGRTPVFPRHHFGWEAGLEAAAPAMIRECERVLDRDQPIPRFNEVHPALTVVDAWKSYVFLAYGRWVQSTCAQCPETAAAIRAVPDVTSAMFSIFPPGTRLPRHRGIYAGVLRYHLGLIVPDPPTTCGFAIGGGVVRWQVGEGFVFDNTSPHEAWNDSDQVRVVLFLDFKRPLTGRLRRMNDWVVRGISESEVARQSRENLRRFHGAVD